MATVAHALEKADSCWLEVFSCRSCCVGASGARAVGRLVAAKVSLSSVCLSYNSIGPDGVVSLAKGLQGQAVAREKRRREEEAAAEGAKAAGGARLGGVGEVQYGASVTRLRGMGELEFGGSEGGAGELEFGGSERGAGELEFGGSEGGAGELELLRAGGDGGATGEGHQGDKPFGEGGGDQVRPPVAATIRVDLSVSLGRGGGDFGP